MDDFKSTAGQAKALDLIRNMRAKYPAGGGLAIISGYAGTGKTTLLRVLAQENPGMFVLTPTGKAAVRVKEAAGCDAKTIHRWMYMPRKNEISGEMEFDVRHQGELELPAHGTLIIDEASMISQKVFTDLWMFVRALGLNMVLIGDGFQLPPVEPDPEKKTFSVFNLKDCERVELTEVLRQALESPIVRISTKIRTQSDITDAFLEMDMVPAKELNKHLVETWAGGGAILCHRNATRHQINAEMRRLRGLQPKLLATDEPLLILKNNYNLEVFNGEVFSIEALQERHGPWVVTDRYKNLSKYMTFQEVTFHDLEGKRALISLEEVFGDAGAMDSDAILKTGRREIRSKYAFEGRDAAIPAPVNTNLGYALTCHKSQGSEWPRTLILVEDSIRTGTVEGRRWFYTAFTRARDRVLVCVL